MNNRVALITGGSRGIGAAIAAALAAAGAVVLAPSRKDMDLSDPEAIKQYVSALPGPIDILVNNAGINNLAGLDELSPEGINDMLQLNLVGPLLLTQAVAHRMKQNAYGRIVTISSIWSVVAKERRVMYAAAKSALNGMTRTLALELAEHGILVNAIAPGYVDTELTRQNNSAAQLEQICANIPLQRLAQPHEIADMTVFLCSEKNAYMTGQVLVLDGGFVCK
ncbi:MAG: SDR family oxidoreductase [Methylococcaceae bacterium]|nr:SDR family oxidoreductase [Methylococcaceae bacterium]